MDGTFDNTKPCLICREIAENIFLTLQRQKLALYVLRIATGNLECIVCKDL